MKTNAIGRRSALRTIDRILGGGLEGTIGVMVRGAVLVISAMILLIVAHVIGRSLFRSPLPGTIELVQSMLVVVAFFTVAYTEVKRGHIRVTVLVMHFPGRVRAAMAGIMSLVCAGYFLIMAWYSWKLIFSQLTPSVARTEVLKIPLATFPAIVAVGSLVLGLECLRHVFHPLPSEDEEAEEQGAA